jgi:hypothetical protein
MPLHREFPARSWYNPAMSDGWRILVSVAGVAAGAAFIGMVVRWFNPRLRSADGNRVGRWVLHNFAHWSRSRPDGPLPPARKPLYYAALALTGLGLVLVLSPFAKLLANLGNEGHFEGSVEGEVFRGFGGLILTMVGRFLMGLAARGWKNVGFVPEPKSTNQKLVAAAHNRDKPVQNLPWDVEAVRHAERDLPTSGATTAVRCLNCHALHARTATCCDRCGARLNNPGYEDGCQ